MDLKNLSDGVRDGIAIFYMKDQKLHAVALTREQVDMLDIAIGIPFRKTELHVANKVSVENGVIGG